MTPSPLSPVLRVFQADTRDSDVATRQTVEAMCAHIHRAARLQVVQAAAFDALKFAPPDLVQSPGVAIGASVGNGDARALTPADAARGDFWFARSYVTPVPHVQFKALVAAFPEKRNLLVSPEVALRDRRGDCSTFSMLIASLLEALGLHWELVTVAADFEDPSLYSHVFVRAVLPCGSRLALDGSHGDYPGWEVPRARQFRRQVWDERGRSISDQAQPVAHLGAYIPRPGLGQADGDVPQEPVTGFVGPVQSQPAPADFNWGNFVSGAVNAWTNIASKVLAPTTTISTGPGGTQISTPGGASLPAGVLTGASSLGSTGSTLLWWGLGIAGVVVVVKALKH